ncbi:DUF84 family protein [Shouchella sp. 1P09AA]|uniref:DUF84 family protein n=1 Tax=unclassified Shouchella TaxID=2893065 RepID=UPI0039A06938
MMTLAVGTKNPAKVHAVKDVLIKEAIVISAIASASGVRDQPLSSEETRKGALNRAERARQAEDADLGIGLEGGVMLVKGIYYICNWGVLVTRDGRIYPASGLSLPLPKVYNDSLESGVELSHIIGNEIGKKDGAIGLLTNGRVTRKQMFSQLVASCYGMYEFEQRSTLH